jgi:hypothetical protein
VQLEQIANIYRHLTADRLSVNDMSLPEGGLFDVYATRPDSKGQLHTSQPPHKGHRVGFAFDVNTHDGAGQVVERNDGGSFDLAVEEFDRLVSVDPTTVPNQIFCESGGRIHVNAMDESLNGLAAQ